MRGFLAFGLILIADAVGGAEFAAQTADDQKLFAVVVLAGWAMDVIELFFKGGARS